jgi:hypothetical protein
MHVIATSRSWPRPPAWFLFSRLNKISQNPSFAEVVRKPLLKSPEDETALAGRARPTRCACGARRARRFSTAKDVSVLLNDKVGEIKAMILERDGKILMMLTAHPRH